MSPFLPEPAEERKGPRGYAESHLEWLKTSTRPAAVEGREIVNRWVAKAGPHRPDLTRRLETAFDETLNELLVRELIMPEYEIVWEQSDGDPDFRIMVNEVFSPGWSL